MTRLDELDQALRAQFPHCTGVRNASGTYTPQWNGQQTAQNEADAAAVIAGWSFTEKTDSEKRRIGAKQLLASNDPQIVLLRGVLKVLYASLVEVRTKAGLPNRSFAQVVQAVADAIDAGQGEA